MAVSKVIYDGETLVDMTDANVTAEDLMEGVTAYGADGEKVTGVLKNVEIDAALSASSTNPVQNKALYAALAGKVKSVIKTAVKVLGVSKSTEVVGDQQLVFPKGAIFSGSAANAGMVTRGICGVTTPSETGACDKENLYINYDGANTFAANRQVICQAGTAGTHYGKNLYQYALARGQEIKAWVEAQGFLKSLPSHSHEAAQVTFADGDTFQGKYDAGELTGPQGEAPIVLLWENAAKTSSFAGQTITISTLSEYDMYIVVARYSINIAGTTNIIAPLGYSGRLQGVGAGSAASEVIRTVSTSGNNVTFGNATYLGSQNNAYLIPIFIYGIKI